MTTAAEQPDLFAAPAPQATWQPAPGRVTCTRNPQTEWRARKAAMEREGWRVERVG
jgi:hypothetical protein